jgi:xanthine dehydrogenase molybdopterin-binding subunit B
VITARDLPETTAKIAIGESAVDLRDIADNVMARTKVLYHGHAVAAVAATTLDIAGGRRGDCRGPRVLKPMSVDRTIAADAPSCIRR